MLTAFFVLTFAASWICWVAAAAVQRAAPAGAELQPTAIVLLYAGTFAPAVVALSLAARSRAGDNASTLLDRLWRGNVPLAYYAFAVGYFPALKLAAVIVHRIARGSWPPLGALPWYLFIGAIAVSTPIQAGEEIGWRGYALPRLAERVGLARASLIVGLIWAAWHFPLFVIPGIDNYGQSFTLFVVSVTALSPAIAWLYTQTGGSLPLVMLMHATVNQTAFVLPSSNPLVDNPLTPRGSLVGWLTAAFLWIGALCLLIRMPGARPRPSRAIAEPAHDFT